MDNRGDSFWRAGGRRLFGAGHLFLFLVVTVGVAIIFLTACAWTYSNANYSPPAICVDEDGGQADSLILTTLKDPRLARDGIVVAVIGGIAAGFVGPDEVLDVVHGLQSVVQAGCSYSGLAAQISLRVDSFKIQAVLSVITATGLLERMQSATGDISDCDKELLERLSVAVESAVDLYKTGKMILEDLE